MLQTGQKCFWSIHSWIISTYLRDAFHGEKFRKHRAGVKSIAAGCRADEYTFDRLVFELYNSLTLIKWNFSKMWHAVYLITIVEKDVYLRDLL